MSSRVATVKIDQLYDQQVVNAVPESDCRTLSVRDYVAVRRFKSTDFGKVFGYDGLFDKFFKDYLDKQVDATGDAVDSGAAVRSSPPANMLAQFQEAQAIRDMFFHARLEDAGSEVCGHHLGSRFGERRGSCSRSTAR